jgi:hypothetical protein
MKSTREGARGVRSYWSAAKMSPMRRFKVGGKEGKQGRKNKTCESANQKNDKARVSGRTRKEIPEWLELSRRTQGTTEANQSTYEHGDRSWMSLTSL